MKLHLQLQKDLSYIDTPYFVFLDNKCLKAFANIKQAQEFYDTVKSNPAAYNGGETVKEDFIETSPAPAEIQPWCEFDAYCSRVGLSVNPYTTWIVEDKYEYNQICIGQEYRGSKYRRLYNIR